MQRTLLAILIALSGCEGPMGPRGFPGGGAPALDAAVPSLDAAPVPDDAEADAALSGRDALSGSTLGGQVRDPSGAALTRGAVVLVPASQVAALAAAPIDLSLPAEAAARATNDEPLEDAIAHDSSLPRAAIAADGRFHFETVPDAPSFVVFVPAPDDTAHLPGGQLARMPFAPEALRGAELSLRVSGAPSQRARYVGNSACLSCHGRHSLFASAHALTLRVPGVSTPQQDATEARVDEALAAFVRGTQLHFSDCAVGEEGTRCTVSTSAPAAPAQVVLRVRLGEDTSVARSTIGRYFVELESATTTARRSVVLTLGGSRSVQQFVTAIALPSGARTHFVLPFSYQLAGDDAREPQDRRWVSYRLDDWLELASGALRLPALPRAFERECAGCHATGYAALGDDVAGYAGRAVSDRDGVYDLDGDGRAEQLTVGCEACHGPGSEHLESAPRGQHIVSPGLLTPERQNLVCGACHARHRGSQGELAPLDAELRMPRAGIARSEFLTRHVSAIDASPPSTFASGDARVSYQQYMELLRSPKYRSSALLVTCSDCHDAHRSAENASDLRANDPNASCVGCHAAQRELRAHVTAKVRYPHEAGVRQELLTCTQCHMVRTGLAGARTVALRDATDPDPLRHRTYFHGDRASHRFAFTDRSRAAEQPVAATSGCAPCHGELLPSP